MTVALAFLRPVYCVECFECIRKNTDDTDANEILDSFEKKPILDCPAISELEDDPPGSKLKNGASTMQ